ncbi:lysozyme inhibitor LprI family protein [Lysobacter xanthus]
MNRTLLISVLALLVGCSATEPSASLHGADTPRNAASTGAREESAPTDRSGPTRLRPQYQQCVDAAAGVVPDTQVCIGTEFTYQEQRLKAALNRKLREGDAASTSAAQAAWRKATDTRCSWNAAEEGQGQRLEANACELEAISARADELSQ